MDQTVPQFPEAERLAELRRYEILDTPPEAAFDDFTWLAAQMCGAPFSVISLVDEDRIWFKSRFGTSASENLRDGALCDFAIRQSGLFEVPDTLADPRFQANPLVTGPLRIRFYAGVPLTSPLGHNIGTLCVLDQTPRQLTGEQRLALAALARQVVRQLELRRARREIEGQHRHQKLLFEAVAEGLHVLDLDGSIRAENPAAERMFGWAPGEMLGHSAHETIHHHQADGTEYPVEACPIYATLRDGQSRRVESEVFWRKDGTSFPVEYVVSPIVDEKGRRSGAMVAFRDVSGLRQKESQLRLLESCLSRVSDVVMITEAEPIEEPGPRIVYVNNAYEPMTGYTRSETLGRTPRLLHGPKTDRQELARVKQHLLRWEAFTATLLNYKKNGEEFWNEMVVAPVANSAGWFTHWVAINRDVTARRRAEEARDRFFNLAGDLLLIAGFDGYFKRINPAFTATLGYSPEELLSHPYLDFIHPDDRVEALAAVEQLGRGETTVCMENRYRHQDGSWRWIAWKAQSAPATGLIYCTGRDSTELKLAEAKLADFTRNLERLVAERTRELNESEQRFQQLADVMDEVFWMQDLATGRVLYASPAYEKIWQQPCAWLYANPDNWLDAVHPEDREGVRLAFQQNTGETISVDFRIVRPDGSSRWIHDRGYVVKNAAGQAYRMMGIAADITERKLMNEQMLRHQRLESLGTLSGGVAHDLNNALAPIFMGLDMLRAKYPADRDVIDTMMASGQRGAEMVRQLLAFARGVEGERVLIHPELLLKEMQKIIRGTFPKNISLRCLNPAKVQTLTGDATQLHQVLLNLCVNARDAMPDGGTLTLSLEDVEVDATFASSIPEARPGPYVRFGVEDTGSGIPPAYLERVFDPFFTTKPPNQGTGLGLATVMGIVNSHGGFVQVRSQPDRGSTFIVYLPATTVGAKPEPEAPPAPPGEFPAAGATILLVEDDPSVREVTEGALTDMNFKVLVARDGAEAIICVAEHRAELRLVITDLHMPHLDGASFIRLLRRMDQKIPVIVTSGLIGDKLAAELNSLGVEYTLMKPFNYGQLMRAIHTVLPPPAPAK
jgi:PAS domain S-box-containing protein